MPDIKTRTIEVQEKPNGSVVMITTPNGHRYRVTVSDHAGSIVILAMNGRIGIHPSSMNEVIVSTA